MQRWWLGIIAIVSIVIINIFTFGSLHTGSMSRLKVSGGMYHKMVSAKSAGCVNLCSTAAVNRTENLEISEDNKDDDEPALPLYVSSGDVIASLAGQHSAVAGTLVKYEPPPDLLKYIKFSALRH